ncbi:Anthrax toxin receptor-like protein, partial [Bos mutus]
FSRDCISDEKANSVQDTSMICPGIKIENPDEAFSLEISLNNGISFINSDVSLTSKDCAIIPYINPLYFFALIPALLLLSLMFCCIWWLCHRRTLKEPPPVLNPERVSDVLAKCHPENTIPQPPTWSDPGPLARDQHEPEETCQMPCPTVIVPCGCQGGGMKRMEGKLDSLCDFVQRCNQMSVMWCPTRDMAVTFMKVSDHSFGTVMAACCPMLNNPHPLPTPLSHTHAEPVFPPAGSASPSTTAAHSSSTPHPCAPGPPPECSRSSLPLPGQPTEPLCHSSPHSPSSKAPKPQD